MRSIGADTVAVRRRWPEGRVEPGDNRTRKRGWPPCAPAPPWQDCAHPLREARPGPRIPPNRAGGRSVSPARFGSASAAGYAGRVIDLRSDTLTKPTAGMRRAMAEAEVGDEQKREDPTVIALEERAAALLGQEAAVYVPTATMANQIALRLHSRARRRGDRGGQRACVPLRARWPGRPFGSLDAPDPHADGRFRPEDVAERISPPGDLHAAAEPDRVRREHAQRRRRSCLAARAASRGRARRPGRTGSPSTSTAPGS